MEGKDSKRSAVDASTTIKTGVDGVLAAQDEEKIKKLLNYKNHIWKGFRAIAQKIYIQNGMDLNDLLILERKFNPQTDECKSPLKKKLKSNNPDDNVVYVPSPPAHGLSEKEFQRIRALKKQDLMDELDDNGVDYKSNWTKAKLLETLLCTLADKHNPPAITQRRDSALVDAEIVGMEITSVTLTEEPPAQIPDHSGKDIPSSGWHMEQTGQTTTKDQTINVEKPPKSQGLVRQLVAKTEQQVAARSPLPSSATKRPYVGGGGGNIAAQSPALLSKTFEYVAAINNTGKTPNKIQNIAQQHQHAVKDTETLIADAFSRSTSRSITDDNAMSVSLTDVVQPAKPVSSSAPSTQLVTEADKVTPASQEMTALRSANSTNMPLQSNHVASAPKRQLQQSSSLLTTKGNGFNLSGGKAFGTSEATKASQEARNARIAQLREASKAAFESNAAAIDKSTSIIREGQVAPLSNNDRLKEVQAKHQRSALLKTIPMFPMAAPLPAGQPALTTKSSPLVVPKTDTVIKPSQRFSPPPSEKKQHTKDEFVNYEMTDTEYNSDSDDEDESMQDKKRVPDWARSHNLRRALEQQYSRNYAIDPDDLFGEVTTCDLEAIFNKKASRYTRRNSSGEWSAHRVTSAEKQAYKLAVM